MFTSSVLVPVLLFRETLSFCLEVFSQHLALLEFHFVTKPHRNIKNSTILANRNNSIGQICKI